jgi:hypothetical protein
VAPAHRRGRARGGGLGGQTLTYLCDGRCAFGRQTGNGPVTSFGSFTGDVMSWDWAADATSAWVLQPRQFAGGQDEREITLLRVATDGTLSHQAPIAPYVDPSSGPAPVILGIRDGDTAVTPAAVIAMGDGTQYLVAGSRATALDGTFAGWAGGTGTYPMP